MSRTEKEGLKQMPDREEFHIRGVVNEPFIGEGLGLNVDDRITKLTAIQANITLRLAKMGSRQARIAEGLCQVREELHSLQEPFEEYQRTRHWFLNSFNRYVRIKLDNSNRIIWAGITAVHGSDARVDAMLYMSPGLGRPKRKDHYTFIDLYGLHPEIVSKIRE